MSQAGVARLAVRLHGALVPAKYGLAGGLAAAAAGRWVPQDVISAAFVALVCCRPSVSSAAREARDQFLATLLGIALGVAALAALGPGPLALGAGTALTFAVATRLGLSYPALVVALFSAVYMGALTRGSWADVADMRGTSLVLGVAVGLAVNLLFAPLLARANLEVALEAARTAVRDLLASVATAVEARDAAGLAAGRRGIDALYRALAAIREDLADMRRDARLARRLAMRPGPGGRDRAARASTHFEQIAHHAQDALDAACELLPAGKSAAPPTPDDDVLLGEAGAALRDAIAALDAAGERRWAQAVALAEAAGRRVRERDAQLAPPAELERRLGPRLLLLVALAELLDHAACAAAALEGLTEEDEK